MKYLTYSLLIMSFISCRTKKYTNEIIVNNYPDLLNIIIDENSIKNDSIYFTVENNSNEKYFFALEDSKHLVKDKLAYKDDELFFPELIINTENNKESNEPYFGKRLLNSNNNSKSKKFLQYLKSFNFKKMIKIKSKEKIKFGIPIPPRYFEILVNPSEFYDTKINHYFGFQINPTKDIELIPKTTLDSLKQNGYKLYRKKINSNKVNFVLDK